MRRSLSGLLLSALFHGQLGYFIFTAEAQAPQSAEIYQPFDLALLPAIPEETPPSDVPQLAGGEALPPVEDLIEEVEKEIEPEIPEHQPETPPEALPVEKPKPKKEKPKKEKPKPKEKPKEKPPEPKPQRKKEKPKQEALVRNHQSTQKSFEALPKAPSNQQGYGGEGKENKGLMKEDKPRKGSLFGQKDGNRPDAGNATQAGNDYKVGLRRAIERHKPRNVRERGVVVVAFTVNTDGSFSGVRVAKSSGSHTLDNAGVNTVNRTGRYRPPPNGTTHIQVPIRFD